MTAIAHSVTFCYVVIFSTTKVIWIKKIKPGIKPRQ